MAVRIYIEIGHEASIRTKKTQEGFTHDWEVFVRGCDGAEIHYYIEKVVFYLHETFPKPKRVIKEPPYVVKESGYAGFNLPIDIYLRNNGEPKKIRFNYDLHLQQSGPPIIKVQKEKYVFNNISDEFRTKLLKGGGMIVNSSNVSENVDNRSNFDDKQQMINKPKLAINSSDIIKKPKLKISDSYNNDNFQELFGSPILTTSKTIDTKQPSWKDTKSLSKSDKEKWRTKHSPHKDSHKDRDKDRDKSKDKIESERKSNRDDKKNKEKLKDRERSSKDKERNLKKERTPSPKRNNSPKRSPARLTSPLIIKHKDSGSSSSTNNNNKHDKDKRSDKSNDDRKLKKEKRNKEHKENKQIDDSNRLDEHRDKIKLEKDLKKDSKDSIKVVKTENPASPQLQKPPKKEKSKDKKDKDPSKEKYKSKKKDKERKDDKEKKSYNKNDKKTELKQKTETQPLPPQQQQQQTPLPLTPNKTTIKKEKSNFLVDEDSSSSSSSSTSSLVTTTTTTITTTTATPAEKKSRHENSKNKDEKTFKTNKKDRTYQDNQNKYNKRKSNSPEREEPPEKQQRDSNINNNLDDKEIDRNFKTTINQEEEDYLNLLRELQHKIMGLKDNNDLTKVVQLIAETGRYEVSAHTFDFDLCLLDRSTVQQLQNFFTNEY